LFLFNIIEKHMYILYINCLYTLSGIFYWLNRIPFEPFDIEITKIGFRCNLDPLVHIQQVQIVYRGKPRRLNGVYEPLL
jgi:hypothetical protein